MNITICCSASFYKQAVAVQADLQSWGYTAVIPSNAELMKKNNDFDVRHYKTWVGNADDYHKKTALMREHFEKVAEGDVTLVLNYEKHGVANYIGGNVLMEMSLAFYLKQPIVILNDIPPESSFLEEIIGMEPVVLHGDLEAIKSVKL